MSSTPVNYYKVYCTTDNTYYYVWNTVEPTLCPTHVDTNIDSNKTVITERVGSNVVKIEGAVEVKEETTSTNGNYQITHMRLDCSANTSVTKQVWFDFPISVLSAFLFTKDEHEDDILDVKISPNTTVGVLTTNATVGDTVFNVSPTVIQYAVESNRVRLTDGVNVDDLGYIIEVQDSGAIITKNSCTHGFSAASPTYVQITAVFADNVEFGPGGRYDYGSTKIGGAYLPKNTIVEFTYTNNSPSTDKSLKFYFEYLV